MCGGCKFCKCYKGGCTKCKESSGKKKQKILVIGGLDRLEKKYEEAVLSIGCKFQFHNGVCGTCKSAKLKNSIFKSDIVVFITSVNSHGALKIAKNECIKNGKTFCVMRETGASKLKQCLLELQ